MATIGQVGEWIARGARRITWEGLANDDDGNPDGYASLNHKTVQVTGTFGTGGSIDIEGSNDGGDTWAVLEDGGGSALTFTSAGFGEIHSSPALVRPNVTAGDATTSLNAYVVETHG